MALQKKGRVLIWIAVLLSVAAVILIVLPLVGLIRVLPWETLRLIYVLVFVAIVVDCSLLLAIARGWFAVAGTYRRPLVAITHGWFAGRGTSRRWLDVVREFFGSLLRPLVRDLCLAFVPGRYAVGFWGVAIAVLLSWLAVRCWPGSMSPGEKVGVGLGIAGLMFGILGYHVAFRVEKSIRTVITDGRQFVKEVSEILAHEIICENRKVKKFLEASDSESALPDYADLICLLWFPYYGLTRDFNHVGEDITRQLARVQELACRTYFITAADPLTLMEHYARYYKPSAIKYDPNALKKVADAIRGKPTGQWLPELQRVPGLNLLDYKVAKVRDCIVSLERILSPVAPRYWTVKTVDNGELMKGLVQVVWTPRKAVIVFLAPEEDTPSDTLAQSPALESPQSGNATGTKASDGESAGTSERTPSFDAGTSFRCSGFVTEDPYMTDMIRDIMRLRFGI